MSLSLAATKSALAPGLTASFLAKGGVAPYTYAVVPGGAGGSINSVTGEYTAPTEISSDPRFAYDVIRVTDASSATAILKILVGAPISLFCEVLQRELGLADGRVYLYNEKIMAPTDSGLFIAVGIETCKPFGVTNRMTPVGDIEQSVTMLATLSVNVISRGPEARDRKEEVILALNGSYAQRQQEGNSFYIAKLSSAFVNLSEVEGAAIPYRFNLSVNIQYSFKKIKPSDYFDTFTGPALTTEN